jgi:hypothetical protein
LGGGLLGRVTERGLRIFRTRSDRALKPTTRNVRRGAWCIAGLIAILIILRQDLWWWADTRLVFGFVPIGLLSQIVVSLLAAVVWWLATRIAWPVPAAAKPPGADATRADGSTPEARSGN